MGPQRLRMWLAPALGLGEDSFGMSHPLWVAKRGWLDPTRELNCQQVSVPPHQGFSLVELLGFDTTVLTCFVFFFLFFLC